MLSNSSKRTLGSLEASLGQKEKSVRPSGCPSVRPSVRFMTQRSHEPRILLVEPPRREKLSHRPPHTIIHGPQQVCASLVLAALCTGVGDVGPKFDTYMPDPGALKVSLCSSLDQLSRKLDGSRTTVKIC